MSKPLSEKECKACGIIFLPTHSSQLYCEKCRKLGGKNTLRLVQETERASIRNMATYYDIDIEMRETQCLFCGKSFQYPAHRGKECKPPDFCSQRCKSDNRISETKCAYCGKPMLETSDIRDVNGHLWFCCGDCKESFKWETARRDGKIRVCPICGKEFLKDTTYCSKTCYRKALSEKKIEPPKFDYHCYDCRKPIRVSCDPAKYPTKIFLCKSCAQIRRKIREENSRKDSEIQKKQQSDIDKEKEYQSLMKSGLCAVCRTSYKDCERMQTQFRVIPKGAQYRDSKIVICPKFTSNQLKYHSEEEFKSKEKK